MTGVVFHAGFNPESSRRGALLVVTAWWLLAFPVLPVAQTAGAVKTGRLAAIAVYPQKAAPATVVSLNNSSLSAQVTARVDEISVRVGELVEAGSVLARLDCTYYHLAREEATARTASLQARARLAQRRLARTRQLAQRQTVSEELLDEREADLAALQADHQGAVSSLKKAEIDVSHCAVTSPYRAIITARTGSVGEFARAGTKLLEIVDIEQLEVAAQVPVGDVGQVSAGATLYFEDSAGRYPVRIRTTVPAINTRTRNQEVRLLFDNDAALPGAAGKLVWSDARPHVPDSLLVRRNEVLGIFLAGQGKARFKALPGAQPGRPTPVELPADTLLVIQGQHGLTDLQAISALP